MILFSNGNVNVYAQIELSMYMKNGRQTNVLMISEVPLKCTEDILQKVNAYVSLYNQCRTQVYFFTYDLSPLRNILDFRLGTMIIFNKISP